MPFIWGEFSLYKQQSSDRWQCLNCAPRATRNNNFTPFTCFWTADGGATVLRSGCYLVLFFLFCFGFFCTVNLTLLKQNVMCPLSLVHYLIKGGKRRPLKDKRNNSTLCINNRVRFDCDGFPERLSRFLFLNCTRPSAAARLHLNTALKPAGDTVTDCTLLSQPAARGR